MLVRDMMQSNPVTVSPETPISSIGDLMSQHRIRHLPVVAGERLLGLISDRDLKASAASVAVARRGKKRDEPSAAILTARDLSRATIFTVAPGTPVEDAARLLAEHRIGSLPVLDGDRFVGIVTDTDVLACFARLVGGPTASRRLEVVIPSAGPSLAEVVKLLEHAGGRVVSLIVGSGPRGQVRLVVRVVASDCADAMDALRAAGCAVAETPATGAVDTSRP